MNNLQSFFNTPLAGTFGQTMFHSLWQGVLIVGLYLIANRLIKSAYNKVWAGLSAFCLQFFASIITFLILRPSSADETVFAESTNPSVLIPFTELVNTANSQSYLELIRQNAHWLFVGWVIGFSFLFLRQIGGLVYVQFLKSSGTFELPEKAKIALSNVLEKIEGKIPDFKALLSLKVNTAMVLGSFKPVILIPSALISRLSTAQLELIIAHEIAHIKRNDFLINLIQTLLENLFFYHPVYWIVSSQIRENREHACDDYAAEITGNRVLLAKTLAQIQLSAHQPTLAMAFGKKKMPMLSRIQRLLGVNPEGQKVKVTALFLMITAMCTFGLVQAQNTADEEMEIELMQIPEKYIILNQADIYETEIVSMTSSETRKDSGDIDIEQNINYDLGDQELNIKTNKYKIHINPDKIIINGKEQTLTAQEKMALKSHFLGMQKASHHVEAVSKEMNVEVQKMTSLQQKVMGDIDFNPQNDPSFQKSLESIQKESEMIAKYANTFQNDLSKLDNRSKTYKADVNKLEREFENKVKVHEQKIEKMEVNMEGFESKMKAFEVKMEREFEIPVREIEVILEKKEIIIDKHADEMEKHHEAIIDMLPKEVRDHLGVNLHQRPERPEKPAKPAKPPKPAKPIKPVIEAPSPPIVD